MGPPKGGISISQEAFDDLVRENMEDLGMEPDEAVQDAIDTLTLQGVDLSGIITCVPGQSSAKEHPVLLTLDNLKKFDSSSKDFSDEQLQELRSSLDKLADLCSADDSGNAAIATKNGAVELVTSVCSRVSGYGSDPTLISALKALSPLLQDYINADSFQRSGGPDIIMGILNGDSQNLDVLDSCFSIVTAAATGNEILKESFMNLKIEECIIQIIRKYNKCSIPSMYDAIRVLLASDDNRVVASQVYGYARRFAETGIAEALVDSLHEGFSSPCLVSASVALKAVAVNDEICRSIADRGGIDALLQCINDSSDQGNTIVAKACCSLLSKLAGSDANKIAIVEKGGMDTLIRLANRYSDDSSVIQEVMSIFIVLCLRSPEHAARAIESGAGDLAIQSMQKFPKSQLLQRNACFMIRNLVARNPENRAILLNNGIEKIIRKARGNHESCKDAATDALRDLGLDNYNS